MDKKFEHKKEILINIYNENKEKINKLTEKQIDELIDKNQKIKLKNNKNPNNFFILKDLPAPKEFTTKTSKKAGILVIVAFITVMLGFLGMFIWLAVKANF